MFNLAKPSITEIERKNNEFGKYEIEPLERGYGTTLGSVLRRTLLSSLPGTAISYIKIDGVSHEFMPLHGMKEDILEFIANLKKVNIMNPAKSADEKIGYLNVKGKKVVTAGDIELSNSLTIVNPDLVIANLGMDDAELKVEFIITDGYGYCPAQRDSDHTDYIAIDSIYSPILKVLPKVESSRIGHDSNFDKLILDITTDGTISPRDALSMSGQIIRDQMKLFADYSEEKEAPTPFIEQKKEEDIIGSMPIEALELSLRTYNALKNAGLETVGELRNMTRKQLLNVKNLGDKSVDEIEERLKEYGIELTTNDE